VKRILSILLVLVMAGSLIVALPLTVSASAIVYSDKATWVSAAGVYETENFADANLAPGVSVISNIGHVTGSGLWWDLVDDGDLSSNIGHEVWTTTWTFADPIYAWGGIFDAYNSGEAGLLIKITYLDGTSVVVGTIPNTITDAFWGFVSIEPFIEVCLEDAALIANACGKYDMDDMVYSVQEVLFFSKAFVDDIYLVDVESASLAEHVFGRIDIETIVDGVVLYDILADRLVLVDVSVNN